MAQDVAIYSCNQMPDKSLTILAEILKTGMEFTETDIDFSNLRSENRC